MGSTTPRLRNYPVFATKVKTPTDNEQSIIRFLRLGMRLKRFEQYRRKRERPVQFNKRLISALLASSINVYRTFSFTASRLSTDTRGSSRILAT